MVHASRPPLFDFDPKKVEIKQKDGTTLEAMAKTRYVVKAQTRLPNGTQVSFEAPFSLEVTNPAAVRALAA